MVPVEPSRMRTRAVTPACILRELFQRAAEADVTLGNSSATRLEQRLERVLRDELIGLERQRAVAACGDLWPSPRHRRIGMVEQRRLDQR